MSRMTMFSGLKLGKKRKEAEAGLGAEEETGMDSEDGETGLVTEEGCRRKSRFHDRERSRDRGDDRRGSRRQSWDKSVTFKEKRDATPTPGRTVVESDEKNEVLSVINEYDNIFVNDEVFIEYDRKGVQLMILDIGCPRSLMGEKNLKN